MESILVDFYNLELDLADFIEKNWEPGWRVPKEERPKILEFFGKHAPKVLKYQTAEEIKALPKPIDVLEYSGTLGAYEESHKISWFDSGDAEQFYWDYLRIRKIVNGYFIGKIPTGHLVIWEKDFANGTTPTLLLANNETKEAISLQNFSDSEIDLAKYIGVRGQRLRGRWDLATSKVGVGLYDELVSLLEGEMKIQRCAAGDCNGIFTPTPQGKEQRYCSSQCRKRAWAQNHLLKKS